MHLHITNVLLLLGLLLLLLGGDVHIHCHLWTIFRFFSLQSGNVNDELRISGRNVFDALKLRLCVSLEGAG